MWAPDDLAVAAVMAHDGAGDFAERPPFQIYVLDNPSISGSAPASSEDRVPAGAYDPGSKDCQPVSAGCQHPSRQRASNLGDEART
jgi:hypothetical protein